MKFIFRAAIVACMSSICYHALADGEYSSAFDSCVKKTGGVTESLGTCYKTELAAQDARLNREYKKAMNILPVAQKQKLLDAQRQWMKFKDADCGMYYSLTGGTIDILNGSDCELSTTKKRADDLAWIAENGGI